MSPPLAAAVAAGVFAGSWVAGGALIVGFSMSTFIGSLVLSGLSYVLTPKQKSVGQAAQNTGITQLVRQAVITRKPTYGEMRRSGGVLFIAMSNNNKYLHMIVEVAPHEVAEIGEVWFNDYSIPPDHLDANGNVIAGRYDGLVRIRKYLGTAAQTADSFLVSEVPEWTTNHRLRGIAYLYVRMQWDQDIFPTGVPNVSAWVRGKKVYDPRTTLTTYNNNAALVLNDYLEWEDFGLGADSTDIDQTFLTAAANTSDEFVTVSNYDVDVVSVQNDGNSPAVFTNCLELDQDTLYYQRGDKVRLLTTGTLPSPFAVDTDYYVIPYQRVTVEGTQVRIKLATSYANSLAGTAISITDAGSGTHTVRKIAEPRYTVAATIDTELGLDQNIKDLLSGMSGTLSYTGGVYRIYAGAYQTPTVYFNENNLRSAVSVQTKLSKRERFNTVRGVYTSPINNGEPTDYPEVTNSTYVAEDIDEIVKQIDMPVTQRPHTCQRIAKINLELSRQEITWSALFDLSAMQVTAGDNAYFTIERFGWTDKIFQVKSWQWEPKEENGVMLPFIRMELREIASANYDWNNGEETSVDPAPNSSLPDVYTVSAVTGLGVSSEFVDTQEGDKTFKILLSWDLSDDQFVLNGGFYEIQYKRSNATDYRPTYTLPGNFDFAEVTLAAELNEDYDIRMRAVNSLGVRSGYTTILNYLVGTSGGVGSTEDWGDYVTDPPDTTEDWGDFSSSPPFTTSEDWGFFT